MSARILIVDDMIQTLKYLSLYLTKDGFEVTTAKSYDDALKVLDQEKIDLILLDVMMPKVDCFEACRLFKKDSRYANIPIIFVTSCDSGDAISQCFDAGGADYVYKFATQRELLVRVKTQLKLSQSVQQEQRTLSLFAKALDVFPHEILAVYPDERIIFANEATKDFVGAATKLEFVSDLSEAQQKMMGVDDLKQVLDRSESIEFKKDFGEVVRQITLIPVYDDLINQCQFVFIVSRDISEEQQLELHLRQSKKMESVSMIAGGAAHDLNNILGGMLGYTSMARMHVENKLAHEFLDKAEDAAEKAAEVISQLLNFAKKKDPKVETVKVSSLVNSAVKLLSSTVNRNREIVIEENLTPFNVNVDIYLVQQALVNVFTALDNVMEESSKISVCISSTFNKDTLLPFLEEEIFGDYIKIIIVDSDNYDELTDRPVNVDISRNKNLVSGLGVAIVSGIIKDFKGLFYIHGDSQKPTGFTVCLPQVTKVVEEEETKQKENVNILILDNEAIFVQMVSDLMDLLGYNAVFCSTGKACIEEQLDNAADFDVLMIDYGEKHLEPVLVMEKFKEKNPELDIILTSSKQVEEVSMIADIQECAFIEKPFKMKAFSELLNGLLAK
ncbi:MAG: response regulator [Lentisphaeraceae bacterium]|nr:response regulator [Lentisphaeraceae bacterium]